MTSAFLAPRFVPWGLGCIAIASTFLNRRKMRWASTGDAGDWLFRLSGLVLLWSLTATLWSPDTAYSSLAVFGAFIAWACAVLLLKAAEVERPAILRATSHGFLVGLLVAGLIVSFELASGKAMTKSILEIFPELTKDYARHLKMLADGNGVAWISNTALNRVVCVQSMLIVPAVVVATKISNKGWRYVAFLILATLTLCIFAFSGHQSSQFALLSGAAITLLALLSRRVAYAIVVACWTVSCLFVVPLVTYMHDNLMLHQSRHLFSSARSRVTIWKAVADEIYDAPILGHGPASLSLIIPNSAQQKHLKVARAHPHNAFLQIWFDIGAVGAGLVFLSGLLGLWWIHFEGADAEVAWLTQFVIYCAMLFPSYGLWQFWLLCDIALGLSVLAIAVAASRRVTPG